MEWKFKNGTPIYQQIVSSLQMRLVNGTYPPGSRMPSVRELAMEAGVNPNTMQRALSELEREGMLLTQRTSGRLVTEDSEKLETLRRELGRLYVREMMENLRALGFERDQIREAVNRFIREQQEEK